MRVEVLFVSECGVAAKSVEAPWRKRAVRARNRRRAASRGRGAGRFSDAASNPTHGCARGDRLEVAGALVCDPKKARRARAESQGDVRVVTCRQARGAQAPGQVCLGARRRGRNAA